MSTHQTRLSSPGRLTSALPGRVVLPEHVGFDEARRAWNLAIDQRPAAVAFPESLQHVAAVVLFAREFGLRVAAQGTGHSAAPLGSLDVLTLGGFLLLGGQIADLLGRRRVFDIGLVVRVLASPAGGLAQSAG